MSQGRSRRGPAPYGGRTPTKADNERRRLDNDVNFVRYFKLLKSMRLVRALKVFKFLRMNRVLARLEYTFIMSQNYFQMLNFLVVTLIFCHFFACAFYFVASQNRFQDDRCAERDASGSCVYYAHRKGDVRPAAWIAGPGRGGRRTAARLDGLQSLHARGLLNASAVDEAQ